MPSVLGDAAVAWRRIRAAPAIALSIVLLVALGVACAGTMFSVIDALVLRPIPFRDADRVLHVFMGTARETGRFSPPAILDAWRGAPVFASVEGFRRADVVVGDSMPAHVGAAFVTPGVFGLLDVHPLAGRLFQTDEPVMSPDSVLISERLWRRAFASAPDAIGRRVSIDKGSGVVVGIMGASFRFPEWNTEVWRLVPTSERDADSRGLRLVARLADGVTIPDALAIATDRAHELEPALRPLEARARPLSTVNEGIRRQVVLLGLGVGALFLILTASAGGLSLVRFAARRHEFGIYLALGASGVRLMRQTVAESAILTGVGSVCGWAMTAILVPAVVRWMPGSAVSRTLNGIDVDDRVVLFVIIAGAVATLLSGVIPAALILRSPPASSLRSVGRSVTDGPSSRLVTRGFVVLQIAMSFALVVAAVVLVRSYVRMASVERGFDPRGITAVNFVVEPPAPVESLPAAASSGNSSGRAASAAWTKSFRTDVERELGKLRGVGRIAWSAGAPVSGFSEQVSGTWVSSTGGGQVATPIELARVSREFLSLYGVRLVDGRGFQETDPESAVVISHNLAAMLFPGASSIGQAFRREPSRDPPFVVVGVAQDIRRASIGVDEDRPEMYVQLSDEHYAPTVSFRCEAVCPSEGEIRKRLMAVPASLTFVDVRRLDGVYADDLALPTALALLATCLGAAAVVAATAGLFVVLSTVVRRRRREFGVRLALGAQATQVSGVVLREGLVLITAGILAGAFLAWSAIRSMDSVIYQATRTDMLALCGALVVVVGTALAAIWRPAMVAAKIDPAELLRTD
jgi:putative ABC transport system permease protein